MCDFVTGISIINRDGSCFSATICCRRTTTLYREAVLQLVSMARVLHEFTVRVHIYLQKFNDMRPLSQIGAYMQMIPPDTCSLKNFDDYTILLLCGCRQICRASKGPDRGTSGYAGANHYTAARSAQERCYSSTAATRWQQIPHQSEHSSTPSWHGESASGRSHSGSSTSQQSRQW